MEGECRLEGTLRCELKEYFPLLVDLINNVYTTSVEEAIIHIRKNVCEECRNKPPGEICRSHTKSNCALDRYYPLVIDAFEHISRIASQLPSENDILSEE